MMNKKQWMGVLGLAFATSACMYGGHDLSPDITAGTLTVDRSALYADGVDAATVTFTLQLAHKQTLGNFAVRFAALTNSGTPTFSAAQTTTNNAGVATTTLRSAASGSIKIVAYVTLSDGGPLATNEVPISFIAPFNSTTVSASFNGNTAALIAAPTSAMADGNSAVAITFSLTDTGGTPLPGAAVTFNATPNGAILSATNVFTDANGLAVVQVRSTAAQTYTVTATLNSNVLSIPAVFTPNTAGIPYRLGFITEPPSALSADDTFAVTVGVYDNLGNLVPGPVSLTLSYAGGSGTLSTLQNANALAGVATFSGLTMRTAGDPYTVVVSSPNLPSIGSTVFAVTPGADASVRFAQQPNSVVAGQAFNPAIVVQILDAWGNVANSNATIGLAVHGYDLVASSLPVPTTAGTVTFTGYALTKAAQTLWLEASTTETGVSNANSLSFSVWPAAPAAASSTLAFSPNVVVANGVATTTLAAHFADAYSNNDANMTVSLSGLGSYDTMTPSSGVTDANGNFTATFQTTQGNSTRTVSITVDGFTQSANVLCEEQPSLANSFLQLTPNSNVLANGSSSVAVTVIVRGYDDGPMAGQTVTLAATPLGTLGASSGSTDSTGRFVTTLTSSLAGTVTVQATLTGVGTLPAQVANFVVPLTCSNDDIMLPSVPMMVPGNSPGMAALADFDSDGLLDMAVNLTATGAMQTFHGAGDGFFTPWHLLSTTNLGTTSVAVVVGADMNGDNKSDLVYAGTDGNIVVLLNPGSGDFTSATPMAYNTASSTFYDLRVADFNGDGHPDVVATGTAVFVFYGSSTGALTSPFTYSGMVATTLAAGDFNHDGFADLAMGSALNGNLVLYYGANSNTMTAGPRYTLNSNTRWLATADLDHDGRTDIVDLTTNNTWSTLVMARGALSTPVATDGNAWRVALGDLSGDGNVDLVFANFPDASNIVSVSLGAGNGNFATPQAFNVGSNSRAVAIADINGDGRQDVVATYTSNGITPILGNGDGTLRVPIAYPTGNNPTGIAVGNLNQDVALDLLVSNTNTNTVTAYLGNFNVNLIPNGTFQAIAGTTVPAPGRLAIAYLNNDNYLDAAVVSSNGNVYVLTGQGTGAFNTPVPYRLATTAAAMDVIAAKINSDNSNDLAVTTADGNVAILFGNSNGVFTAPVYYAAGSGAYGLANGDFNGDGAQDLAVADAANANISVLLNQGNGTFGTAVTYPANGNATAIAVADFNNDNKPDLVVTGASLTVFFNTGTGTFSSVASLATAQPSSYVAAKDLNGDGFVDIISGNATGYGVMVHFGSGTASFSAGTYYPSGDGVQCLAVGDFNGDSAPDLAVLNSTDATLSILLASGCGP